MITDPFDAIDDPENDDTELSDDDDDELEGLTKIKKNNKETKPIKDEDSDPEDEDEDDEIDDDDDDDDPDEPDEGVDTQDDYLKNIKDGDDNSVALNMNFDDFDNEDSDNDDEDNYLQKFDEINKNNLLKSFHPELISHNNDEIDALSIVTRDKNNNIIDDLHKTLPFITKYEIARIIGERAKQIDAGAEIFVDIDDNTIDSYLIALKEFNEKNIPFIIKRPLPNGACEYWKMTDLEILV
jgi:DNA-directed RNA polymerase subunit K/omega